MNDALWNSLMIEMGDLLAESEILQERRTRSIFSYGRCVTASARAASKLQIALRVSTKRVARTDQARQILKLFPLR
jgi:hypothetical protein